jgi:hypothetical protein
MGYDIIYIRSRCNKEGKGKGCIIEIKREANQTLKAY